MVIGGDNLPSPVPIGLNDLKNIGGASGPPGPPVPASLHLRTCKDAGALEIGRNVGGQELRIMPSYKMGYSSVTSESYIAAFR